MAARTVGRGAGPFAHTPTIVSTCTSRLLTGQMVRAAMTPATAAATVAIRIRDRNESRNSSSLIVGKPRRGSGSPSSGTSQGLISSVANATRPISPELRVVGNCSAIATMPDHPSAAAATASWSGKRLAGSRTTAPSPAGRRSRTWCTCHPRGRSDSAEPCACQSRWDPSGPAPMRTRQPGQGRRRSCGPGPREAMAVAKPKARLHDKQPELSRSQEAHLVEPSRARRPQHP